VNVALVIEALDRDRGRPMHRQLYDHLKAAILGRRLSPGARLPSTRALQKSLGVSRNTILSAFEQLRAEGYLEARVGSGTYVAALPEDEPLGPAGGITPPLVSAGGSALSARGKALLGAARQRPLRFVSKSVEAQARPFSAWSPAIDAFDFELFGRIAARHFRNPPASLLNYSDSAGYEPLREAIAQHLTATRGVNARAQQVVIFSGSQHALDSVVRVILDRGDTAAVEDPGYKGVRGSLLALEAHVVPIPVDREGMLVAELERLSPSPRLVHVTPSHQLPLGSTMSLRRRLELIRFAAKSGMWILEDDYDAEFRYDGRPLPALQGLDRSGRVIYVGTFSKVLFPGMRFGYAVLPTDLVPAITGVRWMTDEHPPGITQAILAEFISEGHFARHLRRMRHLYSARQKQFVERANHCWGELLRVDPSDCGMHLIAWLGAGLDDVEVSRRLGERGIETIALSQYCAAVSMPPALVLGFAPWSEVEITDAIDATRDVLNASLTSTSGGSAPHRKGRRPSTLTA